MLQSSLPSAQSCTFYKPLRACLSCLGTEYCCSCTGLQDPVPQFPNAYADPNCYPSLGCNQTWWTVDNLYRIDAVPRGALRCGLPSGNYSICDTRDTTPPPQNSQSCYATVSYLDYWTTADHSIITYKNNLKTCRNSTLAG